MAFKLFKNEEHQHFFDENGFVVVDLLNESEILELTQLFDEIKPNTLKGIYSNVHGNSKEENIRVENIIGRIFNKHIESVLYDCYMAAGTFLVKGTGEDSDSKMHQDWSNVDEKRFLSLNIWCPLIDVDEHNGALQVFKGSHNMFDTIRAVTIPSVYIPFTEDLEPYLTALPLKAGQAAIYTHSLFHGSKPNYSDEIRVAVVPGILPRSAKHIHYFHDNKVDNDKVELFQIDNTFYHEGLTEMYQGNRPDHLSYMGDTTYHCKPLSKEEVLQTLRASGKYEHIKVTKPNLWQKISSFFNA